MSRTAIVCGDSEAKNCVACEGNNRGPMKMRECPLCDGTGNIGLFAGFFGALDRAREAEGSDREDE